MVKRKHAGSTSKLLITAVRGQCALAATHHAQVMQTCGLVERGRGELGLCQVWEPVLTLTTKTIFKKCAPSKFPPPAPHLNAPPAHTKKECILQIGTAINRKAVRSALQALRANMQLCSKPKPGTHSPTQPTCRARATHSVAPPPETKGRAQYEYRLSAGCACRWFTLMTHEDFLHTA